MSKKTVQTAVAIPDENDEPEVTADSTSPDGATTANEKENVVKKPKPPARARDLEILEDAGVKLCALEDAIKGAQRKAASDAIKAGTCLQYLKNFFEVVDVGISFNRWCKTRCSLSEGTVSNYMTVAEAAKKDPAIQGMGLTEAYYHLGIKKRSVITKKMDSSASGSQTTNKTSGGIVNASQASAKKTLIKIADLDVIEEDDKYVVEFDANWKSSLTKMLSEEAKLKDLLAKGLLLRVVTPNPEFEKITALLRETMVIKV